MAAIYDPVRPGPAALNSDDQDARPRRCRHRLNGVADSGAQARSDDAVEASHLEIEIRGACSRDQRRQAAGLVHTEHQVAAASVRERGDVGKKLLLIAIAVAGQIALVVDGAPLGDAVGDKGDQVFFGDDVQWFSGSWATVFSTAMLFDLQKALPLFQIDNDWEHVLQDDVS